MAEALAREDVSYQITQKGAVSRPEIEGDIMLKAICKNLVWMAVPLGLAMGCAANRNTTTAEAQYGPVPTLTPTSGEPEQRIYSTPVMADVDAPPPGASAANWGVAESIRQKLTSDPTLAPLGSSLIAEVGKDNVVTLRGVVPTQDEQKRVRDTIASVPGVNGVNDEQLKIGKFQGDGKLDTNQ